MRFKLIKFITFVNQNFIIRYKVKGEKKTKLIGAGQYFKLVGSILAEKHLKGTNNFLADITTIKLRRGLTIQFVSK